MTVLLSIVSLDANIRELIVLFIGLALSTCALAIYSYRAKLSPLPVCIGAYIVLFISTLAGSSFMVIPFGIIGLLLMIVYFSLQSILSLTFLTLF